MLIVSSTPISFVQEKEFEGKIEELRSEIEGKDGKIEDAQNDIEELNEVTENKSGPTQ